MQGRKYIPCACQHRIEYCCLKIIVLRQFLRDIMIVLCAYSMINFSVCPAFADAIPDAVNETLVYIRVTDRDVIVDQGSGVLVSGQGYIITSRHVIERAVDGSAKIGVCLRTRNCFVLPAQPFMCGATAIPDECIIKINEQDVRAARIAEFPQLSCATISGPVSAYGYPNGPNNTAFGLKGDIIGGLGEGFAYPTTLSLAPGMSGGPVYDQHGKVIGVVMATAGGTAQGYFVPLSQVQAKLQSANVACDAASLISGRFRALIVKIGHISDNAANDRFEVWRSAVSSQIIQGIVAIVAAGGSTESAYLKKFEVLGDVSDNHLSIEQMEQQWDKGLLELVQGTPSTYNGILQMNTDVFVGSLQGKLPVNQMSFLERVDAGQVSAASDKLVFLTLYVIAEDAIKEHRSHSIVCKLLSMVPSSERDVKRNISSIGSNSDDRRFLSDLSAAVHSRLSENSCQLPS